MSTAQEESPVFIEVTEEMKLAKFEEIYLSFLDRTDIVDSDKKYHEMCKLDNFYMECGYTGNSVYEARPEYLFWREGYIEAMQSNQTEQSIDASSEDTTEESEPEQSTTKSTTTTNTSPNANNSGDNLGAKSWYGDDGTYYELSPEVLANLEAFKDFEWHEYDEYVYWSEANAYPGGVEAFKRDHPRTGVMIRPWDGPDAEFDSYEEWKAYDDEYVRQMIESGRWNISG